MLFRSNLRSPFHRWIGDTCPGNLQWQCQHCLFLDATPMALVDGKGIYPQEPPFAGGQDRFAYWSQVNTNFSVSQTVKGCPGVEINLKVRGWFLTWPKKGPWMSMRLLSTSKMLRTRVTEERRANSVTWNHSVRFLNGFLFLLFYCQPIPLHVLSGFM